MKPLTTYLKIKDKVAITYVGSSMEYLVQLLLLRPFITKAMPGIEIDIFGKDEFCKYLDIKPISQLDREQYGYIKKIAYDLKNHPILKFMEESEIKFEPIAVPAQNEGKGCIISTLALLPTPTPSPTKIEAAQQLAKSRGFDPIFSNNLDDIKEAAWVIAPENPCLYLAALKVAKTTVLGDKNEATMYCRLFQNPEFI